MWRSIEYQIVLDGDFSGSAALNKLNDPLRKPVGKAPVEQARDCADDARREPKD